MTDTSIPLEVVRLIDLTFEVVVLIIKVTKENKPTTVDEVKETPLTNLGPLYPFVLPP